MTDINILLKRVITHSDRKEYKAAMDLCNEIISEFPDNPQGYRKRAVIFEITKRTNYAISDITKAISIDPSYPHDYFNRGRWNLEVGKLEESLGDLTALIKIEVERDSIYYLKTAYFLRAECYLQMGLYDKAIEDCNKLSPGFSLWVCSGMKSKEDILRDIDNNRTN
ncbi:MAG: tetratricopeptide repeat protein [Candidatus Dadabacteria bacterium]|nr:tetratricopeptide repeat protein [Candidatus Dadabacteria bacterium]NIV41186.1 tetratricopeptide repeat protein [Candidatus Dadabacteria bacterium]NIX14475.1 tetratricopeptide repeat protein [Candidatus Dadabacteria bacterium]